ncbi:MULTISPECIES: hypothetical protein [Pseudomonas]|uniref:Uncharacterized protein n=2 Tax=Pseudomonas TaxID=286 RepID=A0A2Z4RGH2_PSEPU|nr:MULTISPECIES: hypothetical protein [Pseudomonas]AWY40132.1 hypothetical protein DKY63_09560 [Pseudomonas putida]BCX67801.1 hypothetical protein LAB08_R24380 [Pseudomonas izuensis]
MDIEKHLSECQAKAAEEAAIGQEAPLHNVNHQMPGRDSSVPQKGKTRKLVTAERLFDVRNVGYCIRDTAAILARISIAAKEVAIEGDYQTSTFLGVRFTLQNNLFAEEQRLEELFNALPPRPAPSRHILLVNTVDTFPPNIETTECRISIISPWWLTRLCTDHLGNREDYDLAYPSDIAPSLSGYARVIQHLLSLVEAR